MNSKWLIWLVDHKLWMRPTRNGMTAYRSQAGRYSFPDALEMVRQFQDHAPSDTAEPRVCIVPDGPVTTEAAAAPTAHDKLLEARILKIEEHAGRFQAHINDLGARIRKIEQRLEGVDLHDFGCRISDLEMAKNKTDARVTQFESELRAEQSDRSAKFESVWSKLRSLEFALSAIPRSKTT